jgi:dihydrolipoamide dehydrogenase
MIHVAVIGGGPAGLVAALRAADLGAHTILLNRGDFGGMAANDGPVPVRTLAHAARLMREARQLKQYGIAVGEPLLDYPRLLARVRQVVDDVRAHSAFRPQLEQLGVDIRERTGTVRFIDPHTLETERGERIEADAPVGLAGGCRFRALS